MSCAAQESAIIIGKIIDYETGEAVYSAHIVNLKSRKGTISNKDGFFMIPAEQKDYIKVSFLGYNNKYYQISEVNSDTILIPIYRKTYQLANVDVYPWTKEEFQYQFVHNKFEKDSIDKLKELISVPKEVLLADLEQEKTRQMRENNPNMIAGVSMSAFANYKTKKEKQIIQLEALKRWVKKEKAYRELITHITGYTGMELNAFIRFCNFSKNYISNARDYYLALNIQKKYLEYKTLKNKPQTKTNSNSINK